ncbi:MAG: class I SAM-dependent methyltransferase [Candidatus Thermoplasmatota archaeon]|nr:class I SAM-dependent methyltransferase [Candidatus Thermoplasmatota archaeon]
MPEITWPDEFFPVLFRSNFIPLNVKTVLDVGCGRGFVGSMLRIYRDPTRIVGIDNFDPSIDFARRMKAYDEVVKLDLAKDDIPFRDNEFDLVVCLEVIEHLRKDDGLRLLGRMESVGKRLIISTPGVYFPQPNYEDNPHQAHISFYSAKELRRRGYSVYGVGSLTLWGKKIPHISQILGRATFRFPGLSESVLAIKEKG